MDPWPQLFKGWIMLIAIQWISVNKTNRASSGVVLNGPQSFLSSQIYQFAFLNFCMIVLSIGQGYNPSASST